MVFKMNKVTLNEYLIEGLGEVNALIAHEVQVFFKRFPQRLAVQRKSNTNFLIQDKFKGQIEVSYEYLVNQDVWKVNVNNSIHLIENGRTKSVSEISIEMIKYIIS
tara:strand:+ start:390 stop:707 length:318 start_codon:yes stop_codon:yes gene_type:complete